MRLRSARGKQALSNQAGGRGPGPGPGPGGGRGGGGEECSTGVYLLSVTAARVPLFTDRITDKQCHKRTNERTKRVSGRRRDAGGMDCETAKCTSCYPSNPLRERVRGGGHGGRGWVGESGQVSNDTGTRSGS